MVALGIQFVAFRPPLPPRGEYFLTELARQQVGFVSISIACATAFALGYYAKTHAALIGLAVAAVFPLVAAYEATRFRGSHNLIPFELAVVAVCTVPLMCAAGLGRAMARRAARDVRPTSEPGVA
jgi:hypothetical protein